MYDFKRLSVQSRLCTFFDTVKTTFKVERGGLGKRR
jgi:hypothetical protein